MATPQVTVRVPTCAVTGCTATEALCYPVVVVPFKDIARPRLEFPVPSMYVCPAHQGNVRSPYEFFMNKPQIVRKTLRDLVEDPQSLDFDEIAIRFEPLPSNETRQDTTHNPSQTSSSSEIAPS